MTNSNTHPNTIPEGWRFTTFALPQTDLDWLKARVAKLKAKGQSSASVAGELRTAIAQYRKAVR